jgi:hypothetical protein
MANGFSTRRTMLFLVWLGFATLVIGAIITYRTDRHLSRHSVFFLVLCFVLNLWVTFRPSSKV